MFKRLSTSLGLVFAAFAATTGVSDAATIETPSEVMYLAGAAVVVFLLLVTLVYTVKVYTGWERNEVENPEEEDELHIRSSGYGGEYYDQRYGGDHAHDSHGAGHGEEALSHAAHGVHEAAHATHGTATAVAERPAQAAYGPGSALPLADGSAPAGYAIKGNTDSMLFHTPESPSYEVTVAEVWFESEEAAQAAGFSRWDHS
jgi:hypothetical protein